MHRLSAVTQPIRHYAASYFDSQTEFRLAWERLDDLCQKITQKILVINTHLDESELSLEGQIGLNLLYGAVHYCFTHPRSKKEYVFVQAGKRQHRSLGFITALRESSVDWSDFRQVSDLPQQQWLQILQTDREEDLFELRERHKKIVAFARFLTEHKIVTASQFIDQIKNAYQAIKLMQESQLFTDIFLKRAQVTAYLLSVTLENYNLPGYSDIKFLTAMPDYRLPQLLINANILLIPQQLRKQLMNQVPIEKNSPEEIAMRSAVVIVAEKISRILSKPECVVDSLMWNLSQEFKDEGKLIVPAMLVETDCY